MITVCGLRPEFVDKYRSKDSTVAKPKKGNRIGILVECTEARKLGVPPSRYATMKNRRNPPERLEIKKYNPYLKRHTVHKEIR